MFQKTTLDNGLRVVTAPMPAAKSVAVMVMVAAGSRYETKPTNGIAHFAEHMFFKGTEKRPTAKDISAEVDGIGGEFNAFTSKEYTGYYIKCAAEHRSLALDVLADQILHSKFDADELEREKGVIIEELNMYVDTPRDHVDSVYDHLLFGDQPLGWDIIGTKDTIRAAGRQTSSTTSAPGMRRGAWSSAPPERWTATSSPRSRASSGRSMTGPPGRPRPWRWHRTRPGSAWRPATPTRRICGSAFAASRRPTPTGT